MMESKPITYTYGTVCWTLPNGDFHREGDPAVIRPDGTQYWCKYGKYHRLDGPAVIYNDGSNDWYVNDHYVSYKIHKWANKMNIDLNNLTDEDKFMIRLYWENYDGE